MKHTIGVSKEDPGITPTMTDPENDKSINRLYFQITF
jgi:hypothetical protein